MAMARSEDFKTPEGRLSYARSLFKARAQEGGPLKYGCVLIFPLASRPALEKVVAEVIVAEWGPKGLERAKAGLIKSPFLAGDGKEARSKKTGDIHPGMGPEVFFIRTQANVDYPPWVRWTDKNKQETEATVYSGCYGKAVINAFAWHNDKNGDGVSFGISGFQKLRDGEKLGGGEGGDPEKWVEHIEDAGEVPTETKTGAGASGLFGALAGLCVLPGLLDAFNGLFG
jgi:Protein of unknown function (DUF2815)